MGMDMIQNALWSISKARTKSGLLSWDVHCRKTLWTGCNRKGSDTNAYKTAQPTHCPALAGVFICNEQMLMASMIISARQEPDIISLMYMSHLTCTCCLQL